MKKQFSPKVLSAVVSAICLMTALQSATGMPSELTASAATIPSVPFVLQVAPACGKKVVDIAGGNTAEGTNCQLYERNNSAAQAFRAVPAGNGYYYLLLAGTTDKVLDVVGGKGYSGCNVQLYTANGTDAQLWKFENAGEEIAYYIKSKTGYYLDISGGCFEDGTNIQVYEGNQSLSQLFYFKKNYDADAAINYAYKYTNDSGSNEGPYNPEYKHFENDGGDCANFGSQCIFAGGFVTSEKWDPVYSNENKLLQNQGEYNWLHADGLRDYLQSLGYPLSMIKSASDLKKIHKGDIVFLTDSTGTPFHTTICSVGGEAPKYCCHSLWRKDQDYSFSTFQNGIIVDMSFSDSANVSLPAPKNTAASQQTVQTAQPTSANGQVCRSLDEAIAWINARIAEKWGVDVDNYAGCQCVDFTKAYISYLTNGKTPNFIANAFEYASFTLPDGFSRITSNPQPGDIVVWDKNKGGAGSYGHVGIVTSVSSGTITVAETNYSGMMYVTVHNHQASTVSCYIHPSYVSSSTQPGTSTNTTPGRYKVITPIGVNVRGQATKDSTLIAAASVGTEFVVTEIKNGYGYTPAIKSYVGNNLSDHAGWVIMDTDCCQYLGEASDEVTQPPAQNVNLQPGRYKVITPIGVNVRAQATKDSTLIAAAPVNSVCEITEIKNGYGYTPAINSYVGNNLSNHAGWIILDSDCCEYIGPVEQTTAKVTTTKATTTTTTTTTSTTTTTTTVPPVPKLAGDINTDDKIDVSDAVLMARFVAEDTVNVSAAGRRNADADGNGILNSDDTVTILRIIAHIPVDTWKLDDGKTTLGEVKSEYWEYDIVSKKTTTESTMDGWKLASSSWKKTGTGTYLYASFPSGYNQSDSRYTTLNKAAGQNTESATSKRVYGSASVKEYIYWHWSYPMAEKCSENDRYIGEYCGDQTPAGTCTVWEAFTSSQNVNPSDRSGKACKLTGHSDGYSFWWFKLPVMQQTYTDYQKQYTFQKTEHIKSGKEPSADLNAVNVRHYVLTSQE